MNYGLNLALEKQHRSDEDEIYGAFSAPCITDIPEAQRENYLPDGEVQNAGEEKMDCATRGPINILETKFNWLYKNNKISVQNRNWLEDKGYVKNGRVTFSDAFIAIKSGTTRDGNSMKAPLQAIHEHGLIPKFLMPQSQMTFSEYHNPNRISRTLEILGEEFIARFPIRYQVVYAEHFGELYKEDIIDLAGFAWPTEVNGEYPRVDLPANHVFIGIRNPKHTIFDNYIADGTFIKKLATDYALMNYGYRIYISENQVAIKSGQSLWLWILRMLKLNK